MDMKVGTPLAGKPRTSGQLSYPFFGGPLLPSILQYSPRIPPWWHTGPSGRLMGILPYIYLFLISSVHRRGGAYNYMCAYYLKYAI